MKLVAPGQRGILESRSVGVRLPRCSRKKRLRLQAFATRPDGGKLRLSKAKVRAPRDARRRTVKLPLRDGAVAALADCDPRDVILLATRANAPRRSAKRRVRTALRLDRDECRPRPNVLLIITDDQRAADTMGVMDETAREFGSLGTEFTQAFVSTPLCCPSRASIFSGRFAHNHGVWSNGGIGFDADKSWQAELDRAGYLTGLFGKYFVDVNAGLAPYFDRRAAVTANDPADPELIAAHASAFLAEAEENDRQPWALVLATMSPHFPWDSRLDSPEPLAEWAAPPSFQETDLSDKHPAVAAESARFIRRGAPWPQEVRDGQRLELQRLDRAVADVMGKLRALGEDDTLAIFISDNGYLWGEHGLYHKLWPYRESVQVPLFLRWPGRIAAGARDGRLVANVDIAPTILDAADVEPSYSIDGRSLLAPYARSSLLLEGPIDVSGRVPGWQSILESGRQYIRWEDGFVEDYDLAADPWQVGASNIPDPAMEASLADARDCASDCP